jgi:hypothetical protein
MDTVCQLCGAGMDTPHILLGADVECASCGGRTIPKVPAGTPYPVTGYEITYANFKQLLSDTDYRPSIAPLLRQWFGYEIDAAGESIRIRSGSGDEIDMLSLHRRIQADNSKQYDLYQAAMTLWR